MANGVVYVRRRSLAGPIILIAIGTLFLLGNFHVLNWSAVHHVFAVYWPVLLIFAGLVRLAEYYVDQRHGGATHTLGGGAVFLIILLVCFGIAATTSEHINWEPIVGEVDIDGDLGIFGSSYTFTNSMSQALPAKGNVLRIVSDRGAVTVNSWDQPNIKVDTSKRVRASSQGDAQKIDAATQPTVREEAGIITLNANTTGNGSRRVRSDLQVFVPRKLPVEISTRYGEVVVRSRTGDVRASTAHGDVGIEDIVGNVSVDERSGSVRVSSIRGDVSVNGRVDNVNISDVTGSTQLSGDYFGQITLAKIAKGLTFRSSRTDLEIARLDGDLTMQSGELRAKTLQGPVRLQTRSKDISLEDISGDVRVDNTNGLVRIRAKGQLGAMDINNQRADVELTLPARASFQLDAHAHRGDIETDFPQISVQKEQREDHRASGTVGTGGPSLRIANTYGDISIRKAG